MKKCQVCGKGSRMVGKRKLLRGHYNPTNWTRKYPNLQKSKNLEGKSVLSCTQCIRTLTKESRIEANRAKRAQIAERKKAEAVARMEKRKAVEAKKAKAKQEKPKKDKKEKKAKPETKKSE